MLKVEWTFLKLSCDLCEVNVNSCAVDEGLLNAAWTFSSLLHAFLMSVAYSNYSELSTKWTFPGKHPQEIVFLVCTIKEHM